MGEKKENQKPRKGMPRRRTGLLQGKKSPKRKLSPLQSLNQKKSPPRNTSAGVTLDPSPRRRKLNLLTQKARRRTEKRNLRSPRERMKVKMMKMMIVRKRKCPGRKVPRERMNLTPRRRVLKRNPERRPK